ncbi:hypothetical protein ACET3Z_021547 [Daucus carota]
MFAGHRPQLRRSSRIRQQSFPKSTSTEPIDLVQSSSASEPDDDMEHQTKTYRKSGNKAKVTAGRPVQDSHHATETSKDKYTLADLRREHEQQQNMDENEENSDEENDAHITENEDEDKSEVEFSSDEETDANIRENEEEDSEEISEELNQQPPPAKRKFTKWKRPKNDKDQYAKAKLPNVKFTKKKNAKTGKAIEGPVHLNRAKSEIKIRYSTRLISEMLYCLTDEQKNWARNSGFENLLDFCLEMLPAKLGYNILQIFDPFTVSLKLKTETIEITEEDVYDTLGLPHGGETVTIGTAEMYDERISEWSSQFATKKDADQVTVSKLVEMIKKQGVTQNFKLNFLLVLSNVLIGTSTYTYVDKQLLRQSIEIFDRAFGLGTVLKPLRELFSQDTQPIHSPHQWQQQDNDYTDPCEDNSHEHVGSQEWSPCTKSTNQYQQNQDAIPDINMEDVQDTQTQGCEQGNNDTLNQADGTGDQDDRAWQTWTPWEKSKHFQFKTIRTNDVPEVHMEDVEQEYERDTSKRNNQTGSALAKDPENPEIHMIQNLVNDVFGNNQAAFPQQNTHQNSTQQDPKKPIPSEIDDDFELNSQDIEQLDLIEFLHSAKIDINVNHLFVTDEIEDVIPNFSLGIDEDIYGNNKQAVNLGSDEQLDVSKDDDHVFTPKPAMREKSQRALKLSRYGKSPYVDRVVNINSKLTNQEFGLWKYMIKKEDPIEHMFIWNDFICIRDDMQTLKINSNVATSVIDIWTFILNDGEKYRSDESPLRLFCTIGSVLPSLVDHLKLATTYPIFAINMTEMLTRINRQAIETMHMVFFPIWAYQHYYLVCYNLKTPCYEIIDNIQRGKDAKLSYGPKPRILVNQKNQIMRLRLKYNNMILSSTLNERRSEIIKVGKELYIDMASKRIVNFAIQSSQTSQEEDIAVTTQRKADNKKTVTFAKNLTSTLNEAADNNQ